ncbi:MAG: tRNA (N(6)-L-threonylcarbamoyladenosine(37)-C(2))-methylthiotransferase MtaB [Firmicutes bacterium]|nr:tRNA (N(6)-L-threonylcarbamoyladenosine(37)-C(2))-methylthiotransferase MtaB [Bacillota bacterium]
MEKVAFYTLGCKVNQYETEAMIEAFEKKGYEIVDYNSYSNIYIINTCTVTNMGDRKSRQIIRRALEYNKNAFIAVVGCYSQIAPKEVLNIKGVKLVLGTNNRSKIVELVESAIEKDLQTNAVDDIMEIREFEEMSINQYKKRTRAFVKIQEGCNQYCSYCIIPYARGPIRSRSINSVLREVEELAKNNFLEVILTGIHIGSYGKDLNNIELIDVIEKVHKIDGIKRIRMSSVEPKTLTEDFINRISKLNKICRHFHLSLQSGCNETLKRMNRKYTVEEYRDVVKNLRSKFDDVGITTDIIVGFPGETDEEFLQTLQFIDEISFSSMHIFKYSPRKETPAAKHPNQISSKIKDERSKKVYQVAKKNEKNFINKFINKNLTILFEQELKNKKGFYEGLTHNYIRVVANSHEDISGKLLNVRLVEGKDNFMLGKLIK